MVIGWLCGIGLASGSCSWLGQCPGPAVVHWLRTPTGLYVQSGAALVFQLSGGALVVRDVVHTEKTLAWPDYWFAELEHAIGEVDAEQEAASVRGAARSHEDAEDPGRSNCIGSNDETLSVVLRPGNTKQP